MPELTRTEVKPHLVAGFALLETKLPNFQESDRFEIYGATSLGERHSATLSLETNACGLSLVAKSTMEIAE